jgi:tripartite motif-containing protein 2/3
LYSSATYIVAIFLALIFYTPFLFQVLIFDRPVKDCPLFFDVTEHNSPLVEFGTRGAKEKGFMQPCGVAIDGRNNVFVVDTGNSRIKRLTPNLVPML